MLVSVIIPWHRHIADLRVAVASVLAQDWAELELIVVANGVDDATLAEAHAVSKDARLKIERLCHAGASGARNHGLDIARGELVFFLDADDVFLPGKIATFVASYKAERFDLAFSRGFRDRGDGPEWPMPPSQWDGKQPIAAFFFEKAGNISTSALVLGHQTARHLRFNAAASPYEDPDLVIQAEHLGLIILMLPQTLYRWADHRNEGRLSRAVDVDQRLAWIDSLPANVPTRARAAFRARCVAQHIFPRRFGMSLRLLLEAAWHGAVPIHEIGLFAMRGLLPENLKRRLLNVYLRRKAKMEANP